MESASEVPATPSRRWLARIVGPRRDRPIGRPPQIEHWLEDRPGAAQTLALAAQQISVQSIYLILPSLVGLHFGLTPIDIVNFLCLSLAAMSLAGFLQVLPRGPIGSGYPIAAIPGPVFVAVYLTAAPGVSLAAMSALAVVAGLVGLVLARTLRRLQKVVPSEVAGVVIFLTGISLVPRALSTAGASGAEHGNLPALLTLGTLLLMIGIALKGHLLARFAVLAGAILGTVVASLLDVGTSDIGLLSAAPWLALPQPNFAVATDFNYGLLPAFGVAVLASFAAWAGDLVAFQRAADGAWRQPDTPPIRRGLMAMSLATSLAALFGAPPASTSSACVGLAIGTRILARRVAVVTSGLLLLLACCPKALALVLLLPKPVAAAMLLYVCCFMIAAGCQLLTGRMLDTRRTFTVGVGVSLGIAAQLGVSLFTDDLPLVLQSPVTAGALAAIILNLLTAPLVARRSGFTIRRGAGMPQTIMDQTEIMGGAWGARRETMDRIGHALLELGELLVGRGCEEARVLALHEDDRILITVAWDGATLPAPSSGPNFSDLESSTAAQESFALWLATRHAASIEQRQTARGGEIRLSYID